MAAPTLSSYSRKNSSLLKSKEAHFLLSGSVAEPVSSAVVLTNWVHSTVLQPPGQRSWVVHFLASNIVLMFVMSRSFGWKPGAGR